MTWFTRLRNWQTDSSNGIGIRADYHDSEDNNFATGINASLNISGLNSPIVDIPWGINKITGLKPGTLSTDAANLAQVQSRTIAYAADSVGTDSYAITLSPALTAYAVGQQFVFAAGTANIGAATLNINGLGAITIKKNYNADLNDGDIAQNQMITVVYDGTNFQMQNPAHGLVSQSLSEIYAADGGGSDSYSITLVPAISSYAPGQLINFKANTLNTGGASLNVNGLGAKTIVKDGSLPLDTGDIKASQIVQVIYDGTNFQMLSPKSYALAQNCSAIYAADSQASDTYVITLTPIPTAYTAGMIVSFKANTLNTGACTLNVNSLGAIAIKKFGTTNDTATGDILAGQIVTVIYDGTNFQMVSAVDDINNLTGKTSPDATNDFSKLWDNSASAYKKVNPTNLILSGLPSGAVLQTQQGTFTSTASSTSASFADTGITVNITPASSNNKVLIFAMISGGADTGSNTGCAFNLMRGVTNIIQGASPGSRTPATTMFSSVASAFTAAPIVYLDSPATTSSTTYKVQFANLNALSTVGVNRSSGDANTSTQARLVSTIIVMEIKG